MGEAKRRRLAGNTAPHAGLIYHHTSTLRTNLLWMTGQLETEDKVGPVVHPVLGTIEANATLRRPMRDFPPLVWFTRQLAVPKCLLHSSLIFKDKAGNEVKRLDLAGPEASGISLNRVAIGFAPHEARAKPWRDHPGFETEEGRELNETARDAGDDPRNWYVSEAPVDLMLMREFWFARKPSDLKLTRLDSYVDDAKRMIQTCRTMPGVYIPPSWMTEDQARSLAARLGVPVAI